MIPQGGIASTPTFLLNDITVEADPSWTLSDWQQVIDPLINSTQKLGDDPKVNITGFIDLKQAVLGVGLKFGHFGKQNKKKIGLNQ